MRLLLVLMFALAIAACKYDETISGYADQGATWVLVELGGKPFTAHATISFPAKGKVMGQGPCNKYSSTQTVPLPWFKLGAIVSTKMACPELNKEQQFFAALSEMRLAETLGGTLILSDDSGREMLFTTSP